MGFLIAMGIIAVLVLVLALICRGAPSAFHAKEGLVCVGVSWIAMSLVGQDLKIRCMISLSLMTWV